MHALPALHQDIISASCNNSLKQFLAAHHANVEQGSLLFHQGASVFSIFDQSDWLRHGPRGLIDDSAHSRMHHGTVL